MNRIIGWLCSALWALADAIGNYQHGDIWWVAAVGVVLSLLNAGFAAFELGRSRP